MNWALKYKRKAVRRNQRAIAEDIGQKRAVELHYKKWRDAFLKSTYVSF